jgi:tetratricopeptide (TPR) repeat protein
LGQIYLLQGQLDKAQTQFEEALKIASETRLLFRICEVLPDLVNLHLQNGEMDLAQQLIDGLSNDEFKPEK